MMYIEMSCYYEPPLRAPIEARERYKRYYRDLHSRYNMPLEEKTFLTGSQYTFHDLSYPIFDILNKEGFLNKIDLMAAAFWSHEFDPIYAAIGPHLAHHYHFNCPMFDIVDQGSISPLTALSLIKQYQLNAASETALCFSLDQTTIPRSSLKSHVMPTRTAAGALILSISCPSTAALQIIDVVLWPEHHLYKQRLDVIHFILTELSARGIALKDCILHCKRNFTLYRAMTFYQHQYPDFFREIEWNFLPIEFGCTPFFQFLDHLRQQKMTSGRSYILLLEEDAESVTSGMVILQQTGGYK